jgi:hypothetical protein
MEGLDKNIDHDLLIRIETKLERVIQDVNDIKTNTVSRVDKLETCKVEIDDFKVVSDRVNSIDNWKNWLTGVTFVSSGVVVFLAIKLFEHLIQK